MKIGMNTIGNYTFNNQVSRVKQPSKTLETAQVKTDTIINSSEKDFFMKMYPAQKSEINNYHFYERSGRVTATSLGQNFDRKM